MFITAQATGWSSATPGINPGWGTTPSPRTTAHMTHEAFVHSVRDIVAERTASEAKDRLLRAKLTYGLGTGQYRGITVYGSWQNGGSVPHDFVEIAATGEESAVQLAGTTIHELGHILAPGDGHGKSWKEACKVLGLNDAQAAGMVYAPETFDERVWQAIVKLPDPNDGKPVFAHLGIPGYGRSVGRPCPLGIGTRGGKSRGKGSGSRLRLWECACPVKVRVSSDTFTAHCDTCGEPFKRPAEA